MKVPDRCLRIFNVDITLRLDAKLKKFKKTPWIHSTGNPLPTNHDWWNSTMEKQYIAPFKSASYNSQQEHVISNCVPVGNAWFSNDLPNISNLCKFQHTTCTDNVHDTLLLPLSDDTNLTNIEKSNNSDVVDNWIDLVISVPTNNVPTSSFNNANDNMLMTINEIAVSRNTQSLISCHETIISFSQPHNLCRSLCRTKLFQIARVNDLPFIPSQSYGKSRCKQCLSLICIIMITSVVPLTIRPLNVMKKILAATLN